MKEIVFAGSGGQGILTSGLIISDIAATTGYHVTWVPSYGSAMRGGTANCTVKYGKDIIYNPSQEQPDILLVMNDLSLQKFLPLVTHGGIVVVNDLVDISNDCRSDVHYIRIGSAGIAAQLGNPKSANIVMTGAVVKLLGDFTKDAAINAMNLMFEKKGKSRFQKANLEAFDAGYEAIDR